MSLELLAFIASACGVCDSLPQIFKILRTRQTQALSLTTYSMVVVSSLLWVGYGWMAQVYAIVFWNSLAALLNIGVIILKLENEWAEMKTQLLLRVVTWRAQTLTHR